MLTDVLSARIKEAVAAADDWLTDYVSQPHHEIGRSGAICPFVEPARRANLLKTRIRLVGSAPSPGLITEVVRSGLDEFDQMQWTPAGNANLRSLIIVIPDLPSRYLGFLDEAHAIVKHEAVRRGLMLGQFHENCEEKAARNPLFQVSRSPVPLMAIRSMAIHDVLFLTEKKDWFEQYVARFGVRYQNSPHGVDPLLAELYAKACARYGIPHPS